LEKSYFRLTCAPDPGTVRPEAVLRKALQRLLRILDEGSENYFYCQDQFKVETACGVMLCLIVMRTL
jgi:hypothetical protein